MTGDNQDVEIRYAQCFKCNLVSMCCSPDIDLCFACLCGPDFVMNQVANVPYQRDLVEYIKSCAHLVAAWVGNLGLTIRGADSKTLHNQADVVSICATRSMGLAEKYIKTYRSEEAAPGFFNMPGKGQA